MHVPFMRSFDRSTITLLCYLFAFNVPDGQVPLDDLREILHGGQRMAKVHSGEEILPKVSTP